MSVQRPPKKAINRRKKVSVPPALDQKIKQRAKDCGMPESKWMRGVLEVAVGDAGKLPARKRVKDADRLAHDINQVGVQLRRLGTNINQLAKQANAGLVAVTRAEVQYLLNQHQVVLSAAKALLERAAA